jgi:hypothetical protein
MTVGELRRVLEQYDESTPVVIAEHNGGYGGLFEIEEAESVEAVRDGRGYDYARGEDGARVVRLRR